jgi:two-component system response regulator FlrC
MTRATVLLVDPTSSLRQYLVNVLAGIPKTHLETCSSDQLAITSQRCKPLVWVLTNPKRSFAADGATVLIPEQCVALTTSEGHHDIAHRHFNHFHLPEQIPAFTQWLRHLLQTVETAQTTSLIAVSSAMQRLMSLIDRLANSTSSVFITGESGVGKEVLAREIHQRSQRRHQPFIAVNCAALPETMLESLLFGHERGAYTGAHEARPGKFQLANHGTLLLDEITEIPLHLQAKLLRVLQEREVDPLGAKQAKPVDVRILATSNRIPKQAIAEGLLRTDLYYRLNVFPVHIPPLRNRIEDILPLAQLLLKRCAPNRSLTITASAQHHLQHYAWPGNVRELCNMMERVAVLCNTSQVEQTDLIFDDDLTLCANDQLDEYPSVENLSPRLGMQLQQQESQVILDTLTAVGGNRQQTAQRLGISPRTLRYKLARMRESGLAIPIAH